MSRILIIGASILQLPAIVKAKELGHSVAVVDINPEAVGITSADRFFKVSTNDIDGICAVAKNYKPDGILTLATDMPMRSVATATTLLNLPGIKVEAAIKATDKLEMIKAFKENDVASPWFYSIYSDTELNYIKSKITYPCIIKPTDNSGSRGVIKVNNKSEIESAFSYSKNYSRHGEVLIEEYLEGPEVSVEVLVIEGITHILAITDKKTTGPPYFVELGHSQQTLLNNEVKIQIKELTIKAIEAIGINTGPAHVEIIVTKFGPKMVELGARLGGDCITSHLVPLSTGIDMVKATIDLSLNQLPDIKAKYDFGSAIRYFNIAQGKIKKIDNIEVAKCMPGIVEINFSKLVGDKIDCIKSSTDRIGFVISQGKNVTEAVSHCEEALRTIKILTE